MVIIQYISPLPTLLESSCGPLPRAEPFCLPSACPGRSEAILSRQNAGSCVRDHVCSVWDCEKVSKLGKSWKREPFWPRLREKAAAAPRSPSLFSPPANENPAFFSAYLCHFTKTKTFKALLLDILCIFVLWCSCMATHNISWKVPHLEKKTQWPHLEKKTQWKWLWGLLQQLQLLSYYFYQAAQYAVQYFYILLLVYVVILQLVTVSATSPILLRSNSLWSSTQ